MTKRDALSLQKYEPKQETMCLESGRLLYHLKGEDFEMVFGEGITINPGDPTGSRTRSSSRVARPNLTT